jgi:hypothetical protein
VQPFATGAVYLNFLDNDGVERVKAAYGVSKHARLVEVKENHNGRTKKEW